MNRKPVEEAHNQMSASSNHIMAVLEEASLETVASQLHYQLHLGIQTLYKLGHCSQMQVLLHLRKHILTNYL